MDTTVIEKPKRGRPFKVKADQEVVLKAAMPTKSPWERVIVPEQEPQRNDFVLARVDKAYRAVVDKFLDEATVKPKHLVFNRTMRLMFENVTQWGDKPCINIEVDRSDTDEKPSFYFEY